jgi:hypothetical protein
MSGTQGISQRQELIPNWHRYPGWDVALDPWLSPPPSRIAFGGGIVGPIINISSPNMACNMARQPPTATAVVRAGSNITFHWYCFPSTYSPFFHWMSAL